MYSKILDIIAKECPLPYHNRRHTEEVVDRAANIARFVRPPFGEDDKELLRLAALFHDFGHSGRTIRQTCVGVECSDVSNEEYAADQMQLYLAAEYPVEKIDAIRKLILATSFGQSNPESQYYRPYKPETAMEKVLAFADIAGFEKPFGGWMEENLYVLQEADPATSPATFEAWLVGRAGFLEYCRTKLNELRPNLDADFADSLEAKINAHLESLRDAGSYRGKFEMARSLAC